MAEDAEGPSGRQGPERRIPYRGIFWVFFKAGLAFGGGLGILAVLEDELVTRRHLVSRDEFLATYGLGRIVPSGTMTALAVAYGYRLGGWPGTAVALLAMVLPGLTVTVLLTAAYALIRRANLFAWLQVTILPAALAFILSAALRLGREVVKPAPDIGLALAAFAAAFLLDLNPAVALLAGGLLGIPLFLLWKGPGDGAP